MSAHKLKQGRRRHRLPPRAGDRGGAGAVHEARHGRDHDGRHRPGRGRGEGDRLPLLQVQGRDLPADSRRGPEPVPGRDGAANQRSRRRRAQAGGYFLGVLGFFDRKKDFCEHAIFEMGAEVRKKAMQRFEVVFKAQVQAWETLLAGAQRDGLIDPHRRPRHGGADRRRRERHGQAAAARLGGRTRRARPPRRRAGPSGKAWRRDESPSVRLRSRRSPSPPLSRSPRPAAAQEQPCR